MDTKLIETICFSNNLTVVDALIVSGKGATSGIRIKEADESGYLGYEIRESSLKSCSTHGKCLNICFILLYIGKDLFLCSAFCV